jgi:hypothetical protein
VARKAVERLKPTVSNRATCDREGGRRLGWLDVYQMVAAARHWNAALLQSRRNGAQRLTAGPPVALHARSCTAALPAARAPRSRHEHSLHRARNIWLAGGREVASIRKSSGYLA